MGIIFIMPLPQMLQIITTAMASSAMSQLVLQLLMAEDERVRPMQIMMGPTTMGGKKRITFFMPKILKQAARITYIRPAISTPKQA